MSGFEIVEHTADVGIRANGATIEEAFEQTTLGLMDILDAWRPGDGGETKEIEIEARDHGALLVDWLNEILWLQDATDSVLRGVTVRSVEDSRVVGTVTLASRADEVLAGTAVKAITFHQLRVERSAEGWITEVYVDV